MDSLFRQVKKIIDNLIEEYSLDLVYGEDRGRAHHFRGGLGAKLIEQYHYKTSHDIYLVLGTSSISGIPQIGIKKGADGVVFRALPICQRYKPNIYFESIVTFVFYSQLLPYDGENFFINFNISNIDKHARLIVTSFTPFEFGDPVPHLPITDRPIILVKNGELVVKPKEWDDLRRSIAAVNLYEKIK